ncbi:MAG: hypothetical protein KGJ62_10700 [Armatimonadetes bacterium]|nr:hypothetical protein [Armatimonadota bacterium]MDE2207726.1 hypothetical protein [Armatimonadota bacterium]
MVCSAALPNFITENYEVVEWRNACAILETDFPSEWDDILAVLTRFRLKNGTINKPGGNKPMAPAADGVRCSCLESASYSSRTMTISTLR